MFKNLQWEVTFRGLEARSPHPEYVIFADKLLSLRDDDNGPVYEFLADVCKKTWVRPDEFIEAFVAATAFHSVAVDPLTLQRSIDAGRAAAAQIRKVRVRQASTASPK